MGLDGGAGVSLSTLWRLDLASLAWTLVTPSMGGPTPPPRQRHGFVATGGSLYVHGGYRPEIPGGSPDEGRFEARGSA